MATRSKEIPLGMGELQTTATPATTDRARSWSRGKRFGSPRGLLLLSEFPWPRFLQPSRYYASPLPFLAAARLPILAARRGAEKKDPPNLLREVLYDATLLFVPR
jgi:hypothetical protein